MTKIAPSPPTPAGNSALDSRLFKRLDDLMKQKEKEHKQEVEKEGWKAHDAFLSQDAKLACIKFDKNDVARWFGNGYDRKHFENMSADWGLYFLGNFDFFNKNGDNVVDAAEIGKGVTEALSTMAGKTGNFSGDDPDSVTVSEWGYARNEITKKWPV